MEIEIAKDDDGAIIGFNLHSDCYTEEDFFVWNLPGNLAKGRASIEVRGTKLIIANAEEGTQSFEIPNEAETIAAYLNNKHTRPSINLRGFNRSAHIRFQNEQVRTASVAKIQKKKEVGIDELKTIVSRMFGFNPRKAKGILNSAYAEVMKNSNMDRETAKQFSALLRRSGFKNHAQRIDGLCLKTENLKTRRLFTIH
ncbi:MAG: hypothetical protein WC468_01785 [Candidatus Paceibacterota bacterium]